MKAFPDDAGLAANSPSRSVACVSESTDVQNAVDNNSIPFPCSEEIPASSGVEMVHKKSVSETLTAHDSKTTSSKQTSSDKLSALPGPSASGSSTNRHLRSPFAIDSSAKRGYRHSLDTSVSLPTIFTAEVEPPAFNQTWNTTGSVNATPGPPDQTSGSSSPNKETPKQRVSFGSDRSWPTTQAIHRAFSGVGRGSDPITSSPVIRSSAFDSSHESHKGVHSPDNARSRSPSRSHSRAASPLRLLQHWSAGLHRNANRPAVEEPFVPVNPFKFKTHFRCRHRSPLPTTQQQEFQAANFQSSDDLPATCCTCTSFSSFGHFGCRMQELLTDTLPRQLYLNFLLRLPAMYFSRVARIFRDAEVSRPDIQRMIETAGGGGGGGYTSTVPEPAQVDAVNSHNGRERERNRRVPPTTNMAAGIGFMAHVGATPAAAAAQMPLPFPEDWTPPVVSPALIRFKHSWEAFVDSLLREWKTLNVVSALLLSAILTMFQIQDAESDPITKTAALLSLICGLMSLCYGCMYIVRFGTMRSMYRASRWAEEARKTNTSILWNVWVLLAMPSVWLAWSLICFIISILSFVWRTGSTLDPPVRDPLPPNAALATRVIITTVLALGLIYVVMIIKTLRSYGSHAGHAAMRRSAAPQTSAAEQPGVRKAGRGGNRESVDAGPERRGRERERSVSGRFGSGTGGFMGRKRAHDDQREEGDGVIGTRGRRGGGLRALLGLSLSHSNSNVEDESDIEMDLEKGDSKASFA